MSIHLLMLKMAPRKEEENKKIREESKEKILFAALELFATHGYHPTSISQIAQKAKVSKGLMYNYFSSKEELLKAVVVASYEEAATMLVNSVEPYIMVESLYQILRRVLDSFVLMLKENAEIWKLSVALSMQISNMPDIHVMMTNLFEEVYQQIEGILKLKGRKDAFREARLIAATMDGIALHYLVLGEDFKLDEVKEKFLETFCEIND
jgi:AcrR family transcriptional regulator